MARDMNYAGPSMNPTLKSGDGINVIPYGKRKIRIGDVIVFPSPTGCHNIVHRVISFDSQGIRTRGDNNSHIDPWTLRRDGIIGRVFWAQRGNGWRSIHGGRRGRLYSLGMRAIRLIDSKISSLLHPTYDWLARTGPLRPSWLSARMQTRVFSFDRSTGTELQLLMGQRVIGRLLPGRSQWVIRRPFRLFVDEAALPENPSKPHHLA
jgi:signal peptidase I